MTTTHTTATVTFESVVVRVGWSAGSKTHRGYRAVRPNATTGEPEYYTSHTACGTRGGKWGLGVAKVLDADTAITCEKCGATPDRHADAPTVEDFAADVAAIVAANTPAAPADDTRVCATCHTDLPLKKFPTRSTKAGIVRGTTCRKCRDAR